MTSSPQFPSSQRTTPLVLKIIAIIFGSIPLLFIALFFIAGGPDPGAGSGVPMLFRAVGLPFILAGIFIALPNKMLANWGNAIYAIPTFSAFLLALAIILIAANGVEYLSILIPFTIFGIGAFSSALSLGYYKKNHPISHKNSRPKNEKWVV